MWLVGFSKSSMVIDLTGKSFARASGVKIRVDEVHGYHLITFSSEDVAKQVRQVIIDALKANVLVLDVKEKGLEVGTYEWVDRVISISLEEVSDSVEVNVYLADFNRIILDSWPR